ncbi:MAG: hypothetical protein ABR564_08895 [Candidatus Dormibacteria bacterium]
MTDVSVTVLTPPDKYGDIRAALRLGWAVAEVRGRLRLGSDEILQRRDLPVRHDRALPLAPERTPDEQHIEARKVMAAQAERCGVAGMTLPAYGESAVPAPLDGEGPAAYISRLSHEMHRIHGSGDEESACWDRITDVFRLWDTHIQDTLAGGLFGRASGYQLGRGLAETFWALDPEAPAGDISSLSFLIGDRHDSLCLLVDRISFSMRPYTADAIKGSLAMWVDYVSHSPTRPSREERCLLMKQVLVWRDLLATDTDPLNLLPPRKGVAGVSRIFPVIHAFFWELLTLGAGIAVVALAAVLLGGGTGKSAAGVAIGSFAVMGAAGVALIKGVTQQVGAQLRRSMNRDLATAGATTLHIHRLLWVGPAHARLPR